MLTDIEQHYIKQLCFDSILEELTGKKVHFDHNLVQTDQTNGVFITLKIQSKLRGCIGVIESDQPLYKTVYEISKKSAFADPRFPPLTESEFAELAIECSVMSVPKHISDFNDIKVGYHGLIIRKNEYAGLLLPQVAVEWGWDREQFLHETAKKAGLTKDSWDISNVLIFSAFVF